MKRKITNNELKKLALMSIVGLGAYFVLAAAKDIFVSHFGDGPKVFFVGLAILLIAAYFMDLEKDYF